MKTNSGFPEKAGFSGVPPVADTRTEDRTAQPAPAPTQEILIPWRALASPLQQRGLVLRVELCFFFFAFVREMSCLAGRSQAPEKNGTSSFSGSALAWAVPGTGLALWAPKVLAGAPRIALTSLVFGGHRNHS